MTDSQGAESKKSVNWWKWLGIGCGGCLLTSAIAIGGVSYFFFKSFSTDPQEVETRAKSIFKYDIPGGSRGLLKIDFVGMNFAVITDTNDPPEVLLSVGKIPDELPGDPEELQKSFQDSTEEQYNFKFKSEKKIEKQLCGKIVSVLVKEGEMIFPGQENPSVAIVYSAIVNYDNSDRIVWLSTIGSDSKDKAANIFNSLECQ
ncbi:MAG: hypothetical protein QNJ54_22975 [Prochloraceae cyanobacterium]|nr:hypothetical protein [Prochloraceae cyanobacterium]